MNELFYKQNYDTASKMCFQQSGMVYFSNTKEQNHIFAAVMQERVRNGFELFLHTSVIIIMAVNKSTMQCQFDHSPLLEAFRFY